MLKYKSVSTITILVYDDLGLTLGFFDYRKDGTWKYLPKSSRYLTYIELRRIYNKLYSLNKSVSK
jgi:hypothetical protein